jgi:1-deoxy-D-xylulose-5-phosphate reductoisomerase
MTFPIQHVLLYPHRARGVETALDFTRLLNLEFRPADETRYPLLRLAKESMIAGGVASGVYNAANEVAVASFLAGKTPYLAIPAVVEHTLASTRNFEPTSLEEVLAADAEARRVASELLDRHR